MDVKCNKCNSIIEFAKEEGFPQGFPKNGIQVSNKWICSNCISTLTCDSCGEPLVIKFQGYRKEDRAIYPSDVKLINCTNLYDHQSGRSRLVCDACITQLKCHFCEESLSKDRNGSGVNGNRVGSKWICNSCSAAIYETMKGPAEEHIKKITEETLTDTMSHLR